MDEQRVLTAARAVHEIGLKIEALVAGADGASELEIKHLMVDLRELQKQAEAAAEELTASALGKTVEELRG